MTAEVKPFVPVTVTLIGAEEPPPKFRLVEESDKTKSGDDCGPPPPLCPPPAHPSRPTEIMQSGNVIKFWIVFAARFMFISPDRSRSVSTALPLGKSAKL